MVLSKSFRSGRIAALALATGVVTALSGCAQPFDASVSRFNRELPAQGQSFAVVAEDPRNMGGLEFGQYAALVSDQLHKLGYVPGDPATSDLVVEFDYGVDKGRDKVTMFGPDPYWGPWHGWRGGFYSGGYYGHRWGWGLYDPWFNDVDVTTVYTSQITVKIKRRSDGQRVFEGRAEAVSPSNHLSYVVPNLVEALFTGFPGKSGQTLRISIPAEKKK
jgi:hypothetical protein